MSSQRRSVSGSKRKRECTTGSEWLPPGRVRSPRGMVTAV